MEGPLGTFSTTDRAGNWKPNPNLYGEGIHEFEFKGDDDGYTYTASMTVGSEQTEPQITDVIGVKGWDPRNGPYDPPFITSP